MKLLYVTNTRFPSERAHTIQIAHMCEAFTEQGYDVTLAASNRTHNDTKDFKSYFDFTPSFNVFKLRFGLVFVKDSKLFFVINNLFFCLNLIRKVGVSDFDVVYTRDEWLCYMLTFIVSSKRLVYESHEAKYNFPARQIFKKKIKCVAISQGIYDIYLQKGLSAKQMIVADDAIGNSFFNVSKSVREIREELKIPADAKVAMYIGGLDAWKGVDTFFSASELLQDVLFVAIGGSDKEVLELRKQWSRVVFIGSRPYRELKDNQRAANVLVIPNTAKNELSAKFTSPLKLFAHMSSGIPLVLSRIPSLLSVVPETEAYYFTPDTPLSLSEAIMEAITDSFSKEKTTRLVARARYHTWSKRSQKISNFIRESS